MKDFLPAMISLTFFTGMIAGIQVTDPTNWYAYILTAPCFIAWAMLLFGWIRKANGYISKEKVNEIFTKMSSEDEELAMKCKSELKV